MNARALGFLGASIVLAYAIFAASAPLVSSYVNSAFYGGKPLYRLTWSHYLFPLVSTIATFLVFVWLQREFNWPDTLADNIVFIISAFVLVLFSFVLGVRTFLYTYVLYGANTMAVDVVMRYLAFTPFWAVLPGVFAGWLGAFLAYYRNKKG